MLRGVKITEDEDLVTHSAKVIEDRPLSFLISHLKKGSSSTAATAPCLFIFTTLPVRGNHRANRRIGQP